MNKLASRVLWGLTAVLLGTTGAAARAADFTVHASPIGEYMIKIGATLDQSSGLMLEIAAAAFRKAGISAKLAPQVPWVRAQADAKEEPGGVLVVLARTPGREDSWRWLCVTYIDKVYGYTTTGRPVFSSYEEIRARKPRVGVLLGSASESLLKDMGITPEAVVTEEQNFMKLLDDRLDVMVLQGMQVYPAIHTIEAQHNERFLSRIPELRRTPIADLPLWVVTSKKTPEADARRLQDALKSFKGSAEYVAIVKKYEDKLVAIGR